MNIDPGEVRVNAVNTAPIAERGAYVLYWMIAARRASWSFALDHAIARAVQLGRPLLVFEPLRVGYRWASDRMHAFVLQGMADNAAAFARAGVTYLPYVEPEAGAARGLLLALARRACLVITDEQPGFFLPRMVAAAGEKLGVLLEQVDGNGLLPLRATERAYPTAAGFRRALQRLLPAHVGTQPAAYPLTGLPRVVRDAEPPVLGAWPMATPAQLAATPAALAELPIDHSVRVAPVHGGPRAGMRVLDEFIANKLARYVDSRNHPDDDGSSGLSPWLHFGHVSTHAIAARVWADAEWDPSALLDARATGSREGWWQLPPDHEAFLDELVTWRELSYGFCFHRDDHERWSSLPRWAQATLAEHATDVRADQYTRAQLERAETRDPVWNAAQRQLLAEGRMHNYLRMLWGKKVVEWSLSPRIAADTLIDLNNKYALDGRDPNSYCGIFWTFGRFDRPWPPTRPIFGRVRYMSSAATVKKLRMKQYLARWAAPAAAS